MEAYPFPQNGIRPFRKAGCNVRASVDNARYIDSLRGHLDSGGAVSVHRKRYCNAANVADADYVTKTRNARLPAEPLPRFTIADTYRSASDRRHYDHRH